MPRFRRQGSSGERVEAPLGVAAPDSGGRAREPLNATVPDIPRTEIANGVRVAVLPKQTTNREHPYFGQPSVSRQSLVQMRDMLLEQARQAASGQGARPLGTRSVSRISRNEASFIRFQDKLRDIRATENGINDVVTSLGESSAVLCRQPNGPKTLKWLGSEFAQNLLTRIHHDDRKNAATEAESSALFKAAAQRLRSAGKLTKEGHEQLLEGFDAGMKGPVEPGQAGQETARTVPTQPTVLVDNKHKPIPQNAEANRASQQEQPTPSTQLRELEQQLKRTTQQRDDAHRRMDELHKQLDAARTGPHEAGQPTQRTDDHDAMTRQIDALQDQVTRLEAQLAEITRLLGERQSVGADHKHDGGGHHRERIRESFNAGTQTNLEETAPDPTAQRPSPRAEPIITRSPQLFQNEVHRPNPDALDDAAPMSDVDIVHVQVQHATASTLQAVPVTGLQPLQRLETPVPEIAKSIIFGKTSPVQPQSSAPITLSSDDSSEIDEAALASAERQLLRDMEEALAFEEQELALDVEALALEEESRALEQEEDAQNGDPNATLGNDRFTRETQRAVLAAQEQGNDAAPPHEPIQANGNDNREPVVDAIPVQAQPSIAANQSGVSTASSTSGVSDPLAQAVEREQPAQDPLIAAMDHAMNFMREELDPAARRLAAIFVRQGTVAPTTLHEAIGRVLDQASSLGTRLQKDLDAVLADMPLSPSDILRHRRAFSAKVAALQTDLFQTAFSAAESLPAGRLRFASRLIALSQDEQAEGASERTTGFARDMLANLEENSSRVGAPLRHWNAPLLAARDAADLARQARNTVPSLTGLLPSKADLEYAAKTSGESFAQQVKDSRLKDKQVEIALARHIDEAVRGEQERLDDIARHIPRPDAKADAALRATWAEREAALKRTLRTREDQALEARIAAISDNLLGASLDVRTSFVRAARRIAEISTTSNDRGAAYAEALFTQIRQYGNNLSHPWAQALAAARSSDGKAVALEPAFEEEASGEDRDADGRGEVFQLGRVEDVEVANASGSADEGEEIDGNLDLGPANPEEAEDARTQSKSLMNFKEGTPLQEKAQAIARFLRDKLEPDAADEEDDFEPELAPDVRKALRQPIVDGLDNALAANLLSQFAGDIVLDASKAAQEAIRLVAEHLATHSASDAEIAATRASIKAQIAVPFDRKSHPDAAVLMEDRIDERLGQAIIRAQAESGTWRPSAPAMSKAEFDEALREAGTIVEQATHDLDTLRTPAQTQAPANRQVDASPPQEPVSEPAPLHAPRLAELPDGLSEEVRKMATAARTLETALQALPAEVAGWPDHLAAICYGIDVVRHRTDHTATLAIDKGGQPITSMSSTTAGERLGRLLGLDQFRTPVDPAQLSAVWQGVVTHARQPADVSGLVDGMLRVAAPGHVKAIASAAAAIVQMHETAFVQQPAADTRSNIRQLVSLLATARSTASEWAALAKDNPRLQVEDLGDSKRAVSQGFASSSAMARQQPAVSPQALQNPASLLATALDSDADNPWTARFEQVDAAMASRFAQREARRLASATQSAAADPDLPTWRSIGHQFARTLGLDAVVSAREFTTWNRTQAPGLPSAMRSLLGTVSDEEGLVALLEGIASDVARPVMPTFAEAALKAANELPRQQQQRALRVVGTVFQTLYDRLAVDVNRKGQPDMQRDAQTTMTDIGVLVAQPIATDVTRRAQLAFSARHPSALNDGKA